MSAKSFLAAAILLLLPIGASAQGGRLTFDQAAYVTCREAQAMQPDARRQLAIFLAEHAARYRGVTLPTDERGGQLGMLVRGGCTLAPEAYLFTVIDRAIVAEKANLAKR
ncbi:MAG: hypothetical protein J0H44_01930 [Alphaproteobacteria bacterium]|jgi:hypothetical protein|nr:hypothetical protein [Alphaproteobacteria bacterium]